MPVGRSDFRNGRRFPNPEHSHQNQHRTPWAVLSHPAPGHPAAHPAPVPPHDKCRHKHTPCRRALLLELVSAIRKSHPPQPQNKTRPVSVSHS